MSAVAVREDGLCAGAGCSQVRPEAAVKAGDPFCSRQCAADSFATVKETAGATSTPTEAAVSSTAAVLQEVAAGERLGPDAVAASSNTDERTSMECKVEGCTGDASSAPKAGPTARLCPRHRAEKSAEMSAARTGKTRRKKTTAREIRAAGGGKTSRRKRVTVEIIGRGPNVTKAEKLLAAARNVDETEKLLEQARAQLKQAVDELAA